MPYKIGHLSNPCLFLSYYMTLIQYTHFKRIPSLSTIVTFLANIVFAILAQPDPITCLWTRYIHRSSHNIRAFAAGQSQQNRPPHRHSVVLWPYFSTRRTSGAPRLGQTHSHSHPCNVPDRSQPNGVYVAAAHKAQHWPKDWFSDPAAAPRMREIIHLHIQCPLTNLKWFMPAHGNYGHHTIVSVRRFESVEMDNKIVSNICTCDCWWNANVMMYLQAATKRLAINKIFPEVFTFYYTVDECYQYWHMCGGINKDLYWE